MIRKPRLCRPQGTEPPALLGSREAPTTAIVRAAARISCELRLTRSASVVGRAIFQVGCDPVRELLVRESRDQPEAKVDAARDPSPVIRSPSSTTRSFTSVAPAASRSDQALW